MANAKQKCACGIDGCTGHYARQSVNVENDMPITRSELCQINFTKLYDLVQRLQKRIDELEKPTGTESDY